MRIHSDFRDWYDFAAGSSGRTLRRFTTEGPSKREQLQLLQDAGFLVPPHGIVNDVYWNWWDTEGRWIRAVVACEDETSHCGEGKVVLDGNKLRRQSVMGPCSWNTEVDRLGKLYCTAFVGNPYSGNSSSLRLLIIGRRAFWVEYSSNTGWRSNVGGEASIVGVEDIKFNTAASALQKKLRAPLMAVDFVLGKEAYAVDLNIAPGTRDIGLGEYMDAFTVCSELENSLIYFDCGEK